VTLARISRILVIALVVGLGISQLILTVGDWHLSDAGAYWEAAQRVRDGEALYPSLVDTEASEVYRYAPWFAWAWVPLTLLPRDAAYAIWSLILLGASGAALIPLVQRRAWLLVAFFFPILVGISGIGNVQPLMVAVLVLGIERRSGPVWIGLTASLKAVPLLLALTYLGRGQWRRTIAAVVVTGTLVAPMLLHDLSSYPMGADAAAMLLNWPAIYAIAVAGGVVLSLRLARTPFGWLASSITVALALPRFFVYDVTFLMPAVPAMPVEEGPDLRAIPRPTRRP
jgi:hypothetical protein